MFIVLFTEIRKEILTVEPFLICGRAIDRNERKRGTAVCAELYVKLTQFIVTEHGDLDRVAGLFGGKVAGHKILRRAVTINGNDLVACIQTLLVRGRSRRNRTDRKASI